MLISRPLIGYTLKAAMRDRLIYIMLVTFVLAISSSIFMASAAVTEKDIFASVFVAGSLRLFAVIGLLLFACFYVRRLFENREIEYLLSRPISRPAFVISIALAMSFIAVVFSLLVFAAVYWSVDGGDLQPLLLWLFSFIVELLIVVNSVIFFAMVIPSAAGAAMASLGFYVFCRMLGQLLGIADAGIDVPGGQFLNLILEFISLFMPRLDLLSQTSWLVYGVESVRDIIMTILHGFVFFVVLLCAAIFDLVRREF